MTVKFLWADGKLNYVNKRTDYVRLLRESSSLPKHYAMGEYDFDTGFIQLVANAGSHPTDYELRFMLEIDMERYETKEPWERYAADVEDTEPEFNFGFLQDPHKMLYPPAFENNKMKPDANAKIKAHALNAIEQGSMAHADQWIYFTVYGSGASYNWDETGDFDVQMWVDIDKYNEHHPDGPLTSDELLSMIRRAVQVVNFPSFADIGLKSDGKEDDEGATGAMLIQYYPKAGTGSKEENLAQKPYACYDMETNEWLVEPKPISADFYGQHFVVVESKANDIAEQSESLIASMQRNILNWQFWSGMFSKYRNDLYRKEAQKSQINATIEKQGIENLFEGVFGGRQEAYSPEGEGIDDERDATQKLLEVWGIFQQLKHFARAPLPWDEQDVPTSPVKESANIPPFAQWHGHPGLAEHGTFGFIGGKLFLGGAHHQALIAGLINNGWTWDDLVNAEQAWGWFYVINGGPSVGNYLSIRFTSDSGFQSDSVKGEVERQFAEMYELPVRVTDKSYGINDPKEYGKGLQGKDHLDAYLPGGKSYDSVQKNFFTDFPEPPEKKPAAPINPYLYNLMNPWQNFASLKFAIVADPTYWSEQNLPMDGCFGYVDGHLILGNKHHQLIMAKLIDAGWTWEDLMNADQAWGWFSVGSYYYDEKGNYAERAVPHLSVAFTSDAGTQSDTAMKGATQAFVALYHLPVDVDEYVKQVKNEYGSGLAGKHNIDRYKGDSYYLNMVQDVPPPPGGVKQEPQVPELKEPELQHPIPGGGTPPPKKDITFTAGDKFQVNNSGGPIWTIDSIEGNTLHNSYHYPTGSHGQMDFQIDAWEQNLKQGVITKISALQKFADWNDIMDKAQRLRNQSDVQIIVNDPDHVVGQVTGDHGTYQTEIWRDDPQSQAITMWDCECPWSQYSWGRTRQWKKYEGRPCAHTLALFWEAQKNPPADDGSGAQASPPIPLPGGDMQPTQGLVSPVPQPSLVSPVPQPGPAPSPMMPPDAQGAGGPPMGPAQPSMPTTPQNNQSPLGIPGAFSKVAQFANGDKVRCKGVVLGEDTITNQVHTIPQNTSGEVIYSDDTETVVIFPLSGGKLSPHLVKVEGLTSQFYLDRATNPFIKKKGALDFEINGFSTVFEVEPEYLES